MIFLLIFSMSVFIGVIATLSMLYVPIEIEHPVDAETPRIQENKLTWFQSLCLYVKELWAPEYAMKRRTFVVAASIIIGTVSLVLHFSPGM